MRNYRHVLGNDKLEALKTDSPQNPCSTFSFVPGRMRLSDGGSVAGPHCSAPLASILLSLVSITWTTQKGGCLLSHWTWTSKEPPVALPVSVSPPPGTGLPEEVTELGESMAERQVLFLIMLGGTYTKVFLCYTSIYQWNILLCKISSNFQILQGIYLYVHKIILGKES